MDNPVAQEVLDAVFADPMFGKDAVYTPPGDGAVPLACRVYIDQQDRTMAFGQGKPMTPGRVLHVRASEVATPVRDGRFVIGATTLKIIEDPHREDADGLVWIMAVR